MKKSALFAALFLGLCLSPTFALAQSSEEIKRYEEYCGLGEYSRGHTPGTEEFVACVNHYIGPLKIDQRFHSVTLNGQVLTLTAREFALLDYFCRHPNQVFSRNQLLSEVWGYNHEGYEHTVNTHINRLRTKLDKINSIENGGQLVETVWGVGYKLNVNGYIAKALIA